MGENTNPIKYRIRNEQQRLFATTGKLSEKGLKDLREYAQELRAKEYIETRIEELNNKNKEE